MRAVIIILNFYLHLQLLANVFGYLSIENGHFVFNNQTVFLSGVNTPWYKYSQDFGSGAYSLSRSHFESWFDRIAESGGNVARVWLFIDGNWAPNFDSNGYATGSDTQSLIDDLRAYLDYAASKNIFVILCLWNGAVQPMQLALDLFTDDAKLDAYLANTIKPLTKGLSDMRALGAWEVINEAGGSVLQNVKNNNPCFDTSLLNNTGANWARSNITMYNALKFINRHIDAIKTADPKALVTSGAWSEIPNIEHQICDYCFNYYSDKCVVEAGGKPKGVLDFYQIHTYRHSNGYSKWSPMAATAQQLKCDKLVIIGEMSAKCESNRTAGDCYKWVYDNGYSGVLGWRIDADGDRDAVHNLSYSLVGMQSIRNLTSNGYIKLSIN